MCGHNFFSIGPDAFEASGRKLFIETDWWTDVDDAVAIRLAGWAHRNHKINLVGVGINTTHNNGKWSLDGFVKKETGAFAIPVAVPLTTYTPSGSPPYQSTMVSRLSNVIDQNKVFPDAVTTLRQVLVDNDQVEIVSIGYLNNLQELLSSAADGISALTGSQLVAAKVPMLWVMGGAWPAGSENNFTRDATARAAAAAVVSNWPGPITFIGFEIGETIFTGANLQGMHGIDVLAQALLDMGTPTGRESWDPMALMAAVAGDVSRFGLSLVRGTATVNAGTGANTWVTSAGGNHYYVTKNGSMSDAAYTAAMNALLLRSNWATSDPLP